MALLSGDFFTHLIFIPCFYLAFSIGEWFVHRHMMHEPIYSFFKPILHLLNKTSIYNLGQLSGRHVTHHRLTNNDDMTIEYYKMPKLDKKGRPKKKNDIVLDTKYRGQNAMEKWQNLFLPWPVTLVIFIPSIIIVTFLNIFIFGCNWYFVYITDLLFVLYQAAIWNCMHPMLHEFEPRLSWYEGFDIIPREWFKKTSLYKYLWRNHVLHHIVTGRDQCNFNIAVPLADWLFGTYRFDYKGKYNLDEHAFKIIRI